MTAQLLKLQATPDRVDQVYGALLDAISDGSLAPGQRITQEELAEQLAVSRQPVLQAFRLLKQDGLLIDAPGRGLLVAPLDPDWIIQVYQVRSALDALAARLAAGFRFRIDPALIAQGRQAVRQSADGLNIKAMIDADMAFHNALYAAAQNPLIAQTAQVHWRHLRRVMGAVMQHSAQREAVWDEHQAIADAIERGDGERAARLIEDHAHHAGAQLAEQLTRHLQQDSHKPPALTDGRRGAA